jgi:hypothetical protein
MAPRGRQSAASAAGAPQFRDQDGRCRDGVDEPPEGNDRPLARCRPGPQKGASVLFFFFSNRLGCLGSIAITVIGTLVLLMVFGLL